MLQYRLASLPADGTSGREGVAKLPAPLDHQLTIPDLVVDAKQRHPAAPDLTARNLQHPEAELLESRAPAPKQQAADAHEQVVCDRLHVRQVPVGAELRGCHPLIGQVGAALFDPLLTVIGPAAVHLSQAK